MKHPKRKKKPSQALTLDQVITLANSPAVFSESTWTRVAHTFALSPELITELRGLFDQIPESQSSDPVISAIRRICHPTERLPFRHRRALANAGTSKLSFQTLALEEARTISWRSLDREPISRVSRWMKTSPLAEYDRKTSQDLKYLAECYNALCVARFGVKSEMQTAMLWIYEYPEKRLLDDWLLVEGNIVNALFFARIGQHARAQELFRTARKDLEQTTQDDLVDLYAFLELAESWAGTISQEDEWQSEYHLTKALGSLDATADPWLALFLHHESAKTAITYVVSRMLEEKTMSQLALEGLGETSSERKLEEAFTRLQKAYYDHSLAESDSILRALAHLEACEDLFQEFRTDGLAVVHDWLWAHALVHSDPIESINRIVQSITLAITLDLGDRTIAMGNDVFYFIAQLKRVSDANPRKAESVTKSLHILNLVDQYLKSKRRKTPPNGTGGGGGIPPIASVSIFDSPPAC